MDRRHFLALGATASVPLAGCGGLFDGDGNGRLDLTVRNERADPVTARLEVVDEAGETYEEASHRIAAGSARAFAVVVGTEGRHEATVSGEDWRGQLAWDASTCALFEGTVAVGAERLEVASECVERR